MAYHISNRNGSSGRFYSGYTGALPGHGTRHVLELITLHPNCTDQDSVYPRGRIVSQSDLFSSKLAIHRVGPPRFLCTHCLVELSPNTISTTVK